MRARPILMRRRADSTWRYLDRRARRGRRSGCTRLGREAIMPPEPFERGFSVADNQLKQKIHDVLKEAYFKDPDDLVDVSDGSDDSIHIVIVSRKFDGHRMKEKNDLIWSLLVKNLHPDEWGKVSLSVGASPEEIKAT